MNFKKFLCILLSILLAIVAVPVYASAEEAAPTADYIDGEVLLKYQQPVSKARSITPSVEYYFTETLSYLGITEIEQTADYSGTFSTYSVDNDAALYIAQVDGDVREVCDELEKIDSVIYAEPNYIYETDAFTMPGEITKGNGNIYETYMKWYHNDIMRFPEAWQTYEVTGSGVTVAVIDNGFNTSATDFPANLWDDGNGNHGWNTYDNTNDISPVYIDSETLADDGNHGSNVAGVIGMKANGANGIGGAYSAELMLIKVATYLPLTQSDGTVTKKTTISASALAGAISYAAANGADIINMSLGSTAYSSAVKEQIDNAYAMGCVLVAAAGNSAVSSNGSLFYPAAASNVIGVMASDKTDISQLSSFSNYDVSSDREYYDVAAPGVSIVGCAVKSSSLSFMSGTSQATPLIASCAALYMSYYPEANNEKVYEAIRNASTVAVTSNKEITDGSYIYPLLDAVSLLEYKPTEPVLNAVGANTTIDSRKMRIYGLDLGYANLSDYVTVTDGTMEFTPTELGNGTGSTVKVYDNYGDLFATYYIIIFGDVNGDCLADGRDAVEAACAVQWPSVYTENQIYAADVDKSGTLDSDDVDIIANFAIGKDFIDQA